jgi:hypothetical protein
MTGAVEVGQRVRFTIGNLGAMRKDGSRGFTDRCYGTDDYGTVELELPEHHGEKWFAVTPDDDPTVYVPVHPSMVEVVA